MKCGSCQMAHPDDATHCNHCDARLYRYTWCVWSRYVSADDRTLSSWGGPKLYKTEGAARNAASDLNRAYRWPNGSRIQHVAVPMGADPRACV